MYLIRTPLVRDVGLVYGGPLRVRAGGRALYAGFTSRALAGSAREHWGMTSAQVRVEPWHEAVRHDAPDDRPVGMLVFESLASFRAFLRDPGGFGYRERVVPLHPAAGERPRC